MKKGITLLLFCILLTGCGNKIKCTYTNTDGNETRTVIGKFKGGKLTNFTSVEEVKLDSGSDFENVCAGYKSISVSDGYKVECKNRTVSLTYKEKVKSSKKITKKEFKKQYKSSGYKCN